MIDTASLTDLGKTVITIEEKAIHNLLSRIDQHFVSACELILKCTGRVVLFGMGKSGHIAKKIAATLASTGTPAFYIHPSEACHGDIGMITKNDIALAVSYSGETDEIINILPTLKCLGIPVIALTGKTYSTLARSAQVVLNTYVDLEACPLGLAPTSSTTAMLVMGDALAVALLKTRGFTAEDFAKRHPGGSLGRRLLLNIEEIMHTRDAVPKVAPDCLLDQALLEITKKSFGMTAVVNDRDQLLGVFTDGDLRRTLDKGYDIHRTAIKEVMTENGITVYPKLLAADALKLMREHKITSLIVIDDQRKPLGIVHMHDLLRIGFT